jgi:hypothetical protein
VYEEKLLFSQVIICSPLPGPGKPPCKIIVDNINADFFSPLPGIVVFLLEIVYHKSDITLYLFIVGLEIFLIIILDSPPEIYIFQERL